MPKRMITSKSEATIKKELRKLRKFIDSNEGDPLAIRMACAMETVMQWTLGKTIGWKTPTQEAILQAEIYRKYHAG